MGQIKFEVRERAMDEHEMETEIKIRGKTQDVKTILRAWIG